jgi:hypothetical protein
MRKTAAVAGIVILIGLATAGASDAAGARHHPGQRAHHGGSGTTRSKTCSSSLKAVVSSAKGQVISFQIHHGTNVLDQEIPLAYAPCEPTNPKSSVDVLGLLPASALQTAQLSLEGGGRAFLHLVINTRHLADGHHDLSVVISGPQLQTSVIDVGVDHQYRGLGWAILVSVIAWLVGGFVSAAHATAFSNRDPTPREILRTMRAHWLAIIAALVPAYAAYALAYDSNATFTAGSTSLLALAAKVGAAALSGTVITAGAGAVTAAVRQRISNQEG